MLWKTSLMWEKNTAYKQYSELNIYHILPQNNFNFETGQEVIKHQNAKLPL